jgi:hypothetical protein
MTTIAVWVQKDPTERKKVIITSKNQVICKTPAGYYAFLNTRGISPSK